MTTVPSRFLLKGASRISLQRSFKDFPSRTLQRSFKDASKISFKDPSGISLQGRFKEFPSRTLQAFPFKDPSRISLQGFPFKDASRNSLQGSFKDFPSRIPQGFPFKAASTILQGRFNDRSKTLQGFPFKDPSKISLQGRFQDFPHQQNPGGSTSSCASRASTPPGDLLYLLEAPGATSSRPPASGVRSLDVASLEAPRALQFSGPTKISKG
ncbi:hypothetical protein Q9L58_005577 [Maublancomyces gigas]|uniref:Uncharacterized protein n=1 Tax=Discina gigas TaxID=1032678 RepID=A0ABR3GHV0_9PEZI